MTPIGTAVAEGFTRPKFTVLPDEMLRRLRLDVDSGVIYWAEGRIPGKPIHAVVRLRGSHVTLVIRFNRRSYSYHRVVWFLFHREQPQFMIDHKDRDGSNNRPSNLRRATNSLNQANRKGVDGRDLPKGVYEKKPGRFCAQIGVNGRRKVLGNFDTPEQAHEAYMTAARAAFGEFARGTW